MSLICKPTTIPTPSLTARILQKVYRDNGLSPVYNVNTNVSPCIEDFTSPTYYMSGATKPTTGLTVTSEGVYNLNEVDEFDLTFNFTGSTDYTNYIGKFCYGMIPYLSSNVIEDRCHEYKNITGSSVTNTFNITEVSPIDNCYLIRPWNKFYSKCLTNSRGRTGTTIDTSKFTPIDTSNDNYFVTIVNPPKPTLSFERVSVFADIEFVNETIIPIEDGSNMFLLSSPALAEKLVLSVNGITVSNYDYTVNGNLVTINGPLETSDVIHAYYNKSISTASSAIPVDDIIKLEIFSVTGITTGVTSNFSATTYSNLVNYNDDNDRLEIFLTEKIDPSTQPTLQINGIDVAFNVDFFKSNVVPNKLILNEGIDLEVGDIITVYYYYSGVNNPGDLGILNTNTPNIKWNTFTNILNNIYNTSYADFTVEVAERDDINYNTILNSGTTIYINSTSEYSLTIEPITTKSIKNYIYRVRFDKYFVDRYSNTYKTTTYSDNGSFSLNWNYINNINF